MANTSDGKILGFIPKDQYLKIDYYLLLASGVVGLLSSVLGILGIILGLGGLSTLTGVLALLMSLGGYFLFREEFSELEQNHFAYICLLFLTGFIAGIIIAAFAILGLLVVWLLSILVSIGMLALTFTGYNSWAHGRMMSKDNLKSEIQLAMKRA